MVDPQATRHVFLYVLRLTWTHAHAAPAQEVIPKFEP